MLGGMGDHDRIVKALVSTARPVIRQYFGPDSCIASTRIGIDALARFGVKSEAIGVSAFAYNQGYLQKMNELDRPAQTHEELLEWEKETGAWNVACGARKSNTPDDEWT